MMISACGPSRLVAAPRDLGRLYEAPRVKRLFRDQHFFFFPSVKRGSRERSSALMAWSPPCLAALSGQPPEPERVAPEGARGWRRKRVPGNNDAGPLRCVLRCCWYIPLSLLKCRLRLVNWSKAEPFFAMRYCAASTYIRSESSPYQNPSCILRGHRAPRGWDPS